MNYYNKKTLNLLNDGEIFKFPRGRNHYRYLRYVRGSHHYQTVDAYGGWVTDRVYTTRVNASVIMVR